MENYKIKIKVTLKPSIKDIKAITLEKAVSNLLSVKNLKCRTGSIYAIEFDAENKSEAEKTAATIAEEILSNSVIEEYKIIW